MLCTHNNTDGNKLVIFSSITLYYGDTYIVIVVLRCIGKNITCLLPLALLLVLRTRNNTDDNKLVFSGIALYYGDTYIVAHNYDPHLQRGSPAL